MRDLNNMKILKAERMQQWRDAHAGSVDGFEASWLDSVKADKPIDPARPFVWNTNLRQNILPGDGASAQPAGSNVMLPGGFRVLGVRDR